MTSAVVIGGTRGVGAGIADALLDAGWLVTATDLSDDEVAEFLGCRAGKPGTNARVLDVTSAGEVDAFFATLPTLDSLVNCAGILTRGQEYEIKVFQKVIDVNLTGTMQTCLAAYLRPANGIDLGHRSCSVSRRSSNRSMHIVDDWTSSQRADSSFCTLTWSAPLLMGRLPSPTTPPPIATGT